MALLDDIRKSLRLSSDVLDEEVQMLIGSALYDMERVGVNPALLQVDEDEGLSNPFVKNAVTAYCKAHFGYDNSEAMRFDDSYRRIVCDLLNSSENIAAMEEVPDDGSDVAEPGQEGSEEPEPLVDPDQGEGGE